MECTLRLTKLAPILKSHRAKPDHGVVISVRLRPLKELYAFMDLDTNLQDIGLKSCTTPVTHILLHSLRAGFRVTSGHV